MWSALLSDTIPIAPAQYPHVLHEVFGEFVVGHTGERVRQAKRVTTVRKARPPVEERYLLDPAHALRVTPGNLTKVPVSSSGAPAFR